MRGRFYAFVVSCDCPMAYLIHTEPDGAHCKAGASQEDIRSRYETLPGDEYVIEGGHGSFVYKRLDSAT